MGGITSTWVVQERSLALKGEQEFTRKMGVEGHSVLWGGQVWRNGVATAKACLDWLPFRHLGVNLSGFL